MRALAVVATSFLLDFQSFLPSRAEDESEGPSSWQLLAVSAQCA